MRILIPVSTFERAGGFRVLSELATRWRAAGCDVDFAVDHRSGPPCFPTTARVLRFDKHGLLPEDAPPATFGSGINAGSIYLGMWRALNAIGDDYDVILANHSFTAHPVHFSRAAAWRKVYYIQAYEPEHYEQPPGLRSALLRAASRWSYRLPLERIVNSPLYLHYREIRAQRWIPPGIDETLYRRRDVLPVFGPDRPYWIGTIGRREAIKGTADVLAAFERLAADDPRAHLRVAFGNLPEGWSHPRCEVTMPAGDAELASFYRGVDILAAPGRYQLGACHYPVMEAMASGTPVVTTGYMPADRDNAWIVPVKSPDSIAAAVRDIVGQDPAALRARLDRAHAAMGRFAWPRVAEAFLEAFRTRAR